MKCQKDNCNKKVLSKLIKCKCDKTFCKKHRYYDTHECTHDFKNEYKNKLTDENKKCAPEKLTKI